DPGPGGGSRGAEGVASLPQRPAAVDHQPDERPAGDRDRDGPRGGVAPVVPPTGPAHHPSRWRSITSTAVASTVNDPGTAMSVISERSTVQATSTRTSAGSAERSMTGVNAIEEHAAVPRPAMAAAWSRARSIAASGSRAMLIVRADDRAAASTWAAPTVTRPAKTMAATKVKKTTMRTTSSAVAVPRSPVGRAGHRRLTRPPARPTPGP